MNYMNMHVISDGMRWNWWVWHDIRMKYGWMVDDILEWDCYGW